MPEGLLAEGQRRLFAVGDLTLTSLRGDGRRTMAVSPIIRGATAMMPMASDANQCCQVSSIGADGPRNTL